MTQREALKAAAPYLKHFEAALRCGRLVICAQCREYDFNTEPAAIGNCRLHGVTAYPFVPFRCAGFGRRGRRAA